MSYIRQKRKLEVIQDPEVQNYIYMKKIWIVNLLLLIVVVFLGIEQGEIGVKLSKIETEVETQIIAKREISENIFNSQEIKDQKRITELGFNKPETTIYFDSQEAIAKLPVQ